MNNNNNNSNSRYFSSYNTCLFVSCILLPKEHVLISERLEISCNPDFLKRIYSFIY